MSKSAWCKTEKINDDLYCVDLDYSTTNGKLHFTKEITIWIDGAFDFVCAQSLTPGGWFDYDTGDEKEFESEWPGAIDKAKTAVFIYIEQEIAEAMANIPKDWEI